jgi:glyoxylase-like metal-dependent hydrolase (beta-lactamase superfamily II)
VRIHAIQTGTVSIHQAQLAGRGHGAMRTLNMLFDSHWTTPLPIYAWAIEHPEGIILVDTGESAQAMQPGYFPRWHPFPRLALRLHIRPEDEIGPQLRQIGIDLADVRTVVMTHLHTDHAGGLSYFPKSTILVAREEYQRALGFRGQVNGYPAQHWPSWFAPTWLQMRPEPAGPFAEHYPVTVAGDVLVVPTPGHTPAHVSVVVRDSSDVGTTYFLAGDASYSQELLLRQQVDGISPDERVARDTLCKVLSYVRQQPTVYLTAHDPDSAARLSRREVVPLVG